MDDEIEDGSGGDPTVKLTADVTAWEKALDEAGKAADKFQSRVADKLTANKAAFDAWGQRVADRLEAVKAAVGTRAEAIATHVEAAGKRVGQVLTDIRAEEGKGLDAADAVGTVLGGMAGGALGSAFGPLGTAVGTALGQDIGKAVSRALAESVDWGELTSRFEEAVGLIEEQLPGLRKAVQEQGADLTDTWAGLRYSFDTAWADVGKILTENKLSDLLKSDFDTASAKIADAAGRVQGRFEELLGTLTLRVSAFIDRTLDRFREPLAAIVDFVQHIGIELGLVELHTATWGDAIRELEDVGDNFFKMMLRGFGYVRDAIDVVVGAVGSTLGVAFVKAGEDIARQFAALLRNARETAAALGLDALGLDLRELDRAADAALATAEGLKLRADQLQRDAEAQLQRGIRFDRAGEYVGRFEAERDAAWERVGREDADRAVADFLKAQQQGGPAAGPAAGAAGLIGRVEAAISGSREAIRLAVADATRGGENPNDPARQAADAAKRQAALTERVLDETKAVRRAIENLAPIGVV